MRFLTAFCYLGTAIVFFLPWINIRCGADDSLHLRIASQSGWDAAVGWYQPGPDHAETQKDAARRQIYLDGPDKAFGRVGGVTREPLLLIYFAFVLSGLITCLALRKSWQRSVLISTVAAISMLAIPTIGGFPVEDDDRIKQFNQQRADDEAKVRVVYAYGFYIAWPLTAFPLVLLLIDRLRTKPADRRKPRSTPSDDGSDILE